MGIALTALAVPGFSDSFYFSYGASSDTPSTGGGSITVTSGGVITGLSGVALGDLGMDYWVDGPDGWEDVRVNDDGTDQLYLNLNADGDLEVSGAIAFLGLPANTLLWTIYPSSLAVVQGQISLTSQNSTMTIDSPALLPGYGIAPFGATISDWEVGFNLNQNNPYDPSDGYYSISNVGAFEVDGELLPEPGTLLPLGLGLAGMAVAAVRKFRRRA